MMNQSQPNTLMKNSTDGKLWLKRKSNFTYYRKHSSPVTDKPEVNAVQEKNNKIKKNFKRGATSHT